MSSPTGSVPPSSPLLSAATLGAEDDQLLSGRRYGVVVGGQRLLLDSSGAVRVLEPVPAFRLPNTQPWFLGLANVRGTLVPVYDLARWQGLPAPESGRMLLVVGTDDAAAATLVDLPPRYLLVPSRSCPMPTLSPGFAAQAREAFTMDDGIWTALDWEGLFQHLRDQAVMTA